MSEESTKTNTTPETENDEKENEPQWAKNLKNAMDNLSERLAEALTPPEARYLFRDLFEER